MRPPQGRCRKGGPATRGSRGQLEREQTPEVRGWDYHLGSEEASGRLGGPRSKAWLSRGILPPAGFWGLPGHTPPPFRRRCPRRPGGSQKEAPGRAEPGPADPFLTTGTRPGGCGPQRAFALRARTPLGLKVSALQHLLLSQNLPGDSARRVGAAPLRKAGVGPRNGRGLWAGLSRWAWPPGVARGRGRPDPAQRWVWSRHDLVQVSQGCPAARRRDSRTCTREPQARCDPGTPCAPGQVALRPDILTHAGVGGHPTNAGQRLGSSRRPASLRRVERTLPKWAGPGWRSEVPDTKV